MIFLPLHVDSYIKKFPLPRLLSHSLKIIGNKLHRHLTVLTIFEPILNVAVCFSYKLNVTLLTWNFKHDFLNLSNILFRFTLSDAFSRNTHRFSHTSFFFCCTTVYYENCHDKVDRSYVIYNGFECDLLFLISKWPL